MRTLGLAIAALARRAFAPLVRPSRQLPNAALQAGGTASSMSPPSSASAATSEPDSLALAEVEVVEVEPEFAAPLYATVFARLQLGSRPKLFDLRAARVVPPALFEELARSWQAPRDTVPRLGILLDYERWTVLRNVATRRLQPIVDHGVAVEVFYTQQADSVPGWFAGGVVRHDHLGEVIDWLRTQWRPGWIWPTVLSRTASLVQTFAKVDAAPDLLLELAAIARAFGGVDGAEQAAKHARAALLWVGAQPSRARCRALRALAGAMLARGQPEPALTVLDTALQTAAILQDRIEEASALAEIGLHELQSGRPARAESRFHAALALLSEDDPAYLRATLHHDLALAMLEQRKSDEQAEQHAITALGLRWDPHSQLANEDIELIARIRAGRATASS